MPEWKPELRRRLQSLKLAPMREAAIIEELAQLAKQGLIERE
jgi:hypothetical protein